MSHDGATDKDEGQETSQQKIEANRRNGAKSKGPKTKAGKAKSSLNAVKHGMAAKTLIIPGLEKKKVMRKLHRRIRKGLGPVGVLEELAAEAIFVAYWRLSRCLRSEAMAFATAATDHDNDEDLEDIEPADQKFTLPDSFVLKKHGRYERARRRDLEQAIAGFEKRQQAREKPPRHPSDQKD